MTSFLFIFAARKGTLVDVCECLKGKNMKTRKITESTLWTPEENLNRYSGFRAFKRRIDEQLQLMDSDIRVDDDDLLPFYRMGESENFVLGALGCQTM